MHKGEKRAADAPVQWLSCGRQVSRALEIGLLAASLLAVACLNSRSASEEFSLQQAAQTLATAAMPDTELREEAQYEMTELDSLRTEIFNLFVFESEENEEEAPKNIVLPFAAILQNPELPNGCEITSATSVLNYLGFSVDKLTMADTYLPCTEPWYDADPELAYMGDPCGEGWYCYAAPIVTAVNDYLADAGADGEYAAADITGADLSELKEYLQRGTPVVVWVTIDFAEPVRSAEYVLSTGEAPYVNLHCLVMTGYDEESVYVADPLGLITQVDTATFEEIYTAMGSRAAVIEELGK